MPPRPPWRPPGRRSASGLTGATVVGLAALAVSAVVLARSFEWAALTATWAAAVRDPFGMVLALAAYAAAFALRAWAWGRVLPGLGFGQALAGIHVGLAGNHLLPARLGEPLRAVSVVRRAGVGAREAAASTVALRAADLLAVLALAGALAPGLIPGLAARALGVWAWAVAALVAAAGAAAWWWLGRLGAARRAGFAVAAVALAAWVLEAGVVWAAARWAGLDAGPADALLVAVVSVAAQVVALAPGGFGTYEAAAVAAWALLGVPAAPALAAAIAAHATKTAYALVAGLIGAVLPAPGLFGRLRLPAARTRPRPPVAGPGQGGVLVFLPAHDEAATVAGVIARVPATVSGRPVRCVVVDDGSTDGTAEAAGRAGAEVMRLARPLGLGAAVRRGLAEGVAAGAAVVAFCDADGEYDPAELARLVDPILDGEADYVVGSRFDGEIRRMLPHRRLGNRALTAWLSLLARRRLRDGQSGYRALSGPAAASAEVVHDYNYAQVLTLDLLAKGWRMREVPIGYEFRRHGRSFVRPGPYLRRVVPAVHRELNAP
jgi:uncharacterized membrane protein YbhN (UPF0104 family)